jgi:hypothetical protein
MGEGFIKKRSGLTNHLRDGMSRCAPADYSSCLVASNTALWPRKRRPAHRAHWRGQHR